MKEKTLSSASLFTVSAVSDASALVLGGTAGSALGMVGLLALVLGALRISGDVNSGSSTWWTWVSGALAATCFLFLGLSL